MARSQRQRDDYDFRHSYHEIIKSCNLLMSDKRQTREVRQTIQTTSLLSTVPLCKRIQQLCDLWYSSTTAFCLERRAKFTLRKSQNFKLKNISCQLTDFLNSTVCCNGKQIPEKKKLKPVLQLLFFFCSHLYFSLYSWV